MSSIIAITLRKGGSGKTTTAVNLASGLVNKGHKTLLVDLDSSANATKDSYINNPKITLTNILTEDIDIKSSIHKTDYNYDIIPSDLKLGSVERGFQQLQVFLIKDLLKPLKNNYKYIILDTGPSDGALVNNALCAANYVLIPMQTNLLALEGVEMTLNAIKTIKQYHNKGLSILGILATLYNTRASISELIFRELKEKYPKLTLPFYIKYTTYIAEASYNQGPLSSYDQKALDYSGYNELTNYIIKEVK